LPVTFADRIRQARSAWYRWRFRHILEASRS
jgi:hypothetical protein